MYDEQQYKLDHLIYLLDSAGNLQRISVHGNVFKQDLKFNLNLSWNKLAMDFIKLNEKV